MSSETCIPQARTMCPGKHLPMCQERTVTHRFLRLVAYFYIANAMHLVWSRNSLMVFVNIIHQSLTSFNEPQYYAPFKCRYRHTIHRHTYAIQPIYCETNKNSLSTSCFPLYRNHRLQYLLGLSVMHQNLCLGYTIIAYGVSVFCDTR